METRMWKQTRAAVRQVLNEAGDTPHFFDLSDAQRLNWMIARGFELGRRWCGNIRSVNRKDANAKRGKARENGNRI